MRMALLVITALMGMSPIMASPTSGLLPSLPSHFSVNWSIGPKDSTVSQDFVVTARGLYDFEMIFQEPHDLEAFRKLFFFTGGGSSVWVTKETARSGTYLVT